VHQTDNDKAEGNRVPPALAVASARVGGEAYQSAPLFIQDNLDKLDQERRSAKTPDFVVTVLESEKLSSYGKFCWTISLRPDFETDFALSARSAYLLHGTPQVTFSDLTHYGSGDPYKAITAVIPGSQENDKIALVIVLYALSSKPVLRELNVMLETRVNCS